MAQPDKKKKSGRDEGLPTEVRELVDLVVTYAKQQTLDPLKALGRWVGFGIGGAALVGLGVFLLGLALLRLLQTELRRQLSGDLSWLAYLIVVGFLGAVMALVVRAIAHGPGNEER